MKLPFFFLKAKKGIAFFFVFDYNKIDFFF